MLIGGVLASGGSRSQWVVESSFGAGVTINDVAFADPLHGWAAGDGGALFVTDDGGQSWRTVVDGVTDTLRRLTFVDTAHGYAVGDATVLRTGDGGASWSRIVSSSLPAGMQDLAAPSVGSLVAAAQPAGATGGLYRSADGGLTWQTALTPPSGLGFDRVVFTGPTTGWVAGTAGLYRTADGGRTWSMIDLHLSSYEALAFLSPSFGYIGGLSETAKGRWSATFLRTTDGGATWATTMLRAVTSPGGAQVRALAFAPDQLQGLAVVGSALYDTQDGGATWTRHTLPRGAAGEAIVVGYRGTDPFMATGGSFLHDGPVAAMATATGTSVPETVGSVPPTVQATPPAQSEPGTPILFPSPTPYSRLAFASPTPDTQVVFAAPTAIPLALAGIVPDVAVAASSVRLTARGTGFDALATVTIGATDITDVRLIDAGSLSFMLPASVGPGTYAVAVAEPDGRHTVLSRALTVLPRLMLRAHLLHPVVARGTTAVVLAQTTPGAQLSARVVDAHGRTPAGVSVTVQRGPRGEWRVLLAMGSRMSIGPARVLVLARWQGQQARALLPLRVRA
jgi:photosystem II stability/assembly factor-like uncharacterized protein